jgi:hypothetical protein
LDAVVLVLPAAAGQSRRLCSSALPVSVVVGIVGIIASLRRRIVASSSLLSLVLTTFTAAIALASAIVVAVAVAANAAAAALR